MSYRPPLRLTSYARCCQYGSDTIELTGSFDYPGGSAVIFNIYPDVEVMRVRQIIIQAKRPNTGQPASIETFGVGPAGTNTDAPPFYAISVGSPAATRLDTNIFINKNYGLAIFVYGGAERLTIDYVVRGEILDLPLHVEHIVGTLDVPHTPAGNDTAYVDICVEKNAIMLALGAASLNSEYVDLYLYSVNGFKDVLSDAGSSQNVYRKGQSLGRYVLTQIVMPLVRGGTCPRLSVTNKDNITVTVVYGANIVYFE